ncbi:hypothetical protein [Thermus thermophilus]|uniref:hypothetical protein n=1 Tax=Thermus thermophilus TaxID=274 RepID=UPI001CC76C57|nr:hypothetical protein [Thermus thermophilus]
MRVHGKNQSYGARQEERALFLERLRAKHGLGPLVLKDHLSLALEGSTGKPSHPGPGQHRVV